MKVRPVGGLARQWSMVVALERGAAAPFLAMLALVMLPACHRVSAPVVVTTEAGEPDGGAPEDGVLEALRLAGMAACGEACAHIDACTVRDDLVPCAAECREDLMGSNGVSALRYAGCVQELSCEAITSTQQQAIGPLGQCYLTAARATR
jgi:hypothetical protein